MEITEPLVLATGSHQAGSGQGCVMNVVSWENGDIEITDYPSCVARPLAKLMQDLNDLICNHTESDALCADCAVTVLDLGHQVVGTANYTPDQLGAWLQELIENPVWGARQYSATCAATRAAAAAAAQATAAAVADGAVYAANAAAHAADATTYAIHRNPAARAARLQHARQAIAAWHRICGTTPAPVDSEKLNTALRAMATVH